MKTFDVIRHSMQDARLNPAVDCENYFQVNWKNSYTGRKHTVIICGNDEVQVLKYWKEWRNSDQEYTTSVDNLSATGI